MDHNGYGDTFSALEVIFYNEVRYISLRFTYLLNYLPDKYFLHWSLIV